MNHQGQEMTATNRFRLIAALAATSMIFAACGGGEESAAETAPTTVAATSSTVAEQMDDMDGTEGDEHEHEHGAATEWAGSDVPTVQVSVEGDATSGWTVTAQIDESFRFGTPENAVHEDGVGHAHLVIDGVVARMIYEPTVTIDSLEPGMHTIEVRLASSDHTDYVSDGEIIAGMAMVEVAGEVQAADVTVTASFVAGQIDTDSDRVEVSLGDIVEITVSSDVAEEVHLHGYDITSDIEAGGSTTLRFTAEVPGIFEVELEDSHELVVELVIS